PDPNTSRATPRAGPAGAPRQTSSATGRESPQQEGVLQTAGGGRAASPDDSATAARTWRKTAPNGNRLAAGAGLWRSRSAGGESPALAFPSGWSSGHDDALSSPYSDS